MKAEHVLIMGGSSGIGLASARLLLAGGYRVTIGGRDGRRLQAAHTALEGRAETLQLDAADTGAVRAAYAQLGALDHLVLALGSGQGAGPFATVDMASVRKGFEEKVFPHFACAQAAVPILNRQGSIVFVSAVSANAAMPGTAGLGAHNAAVAALVPILAAELKPLRVNGVSPGVIDTPWWDFLDEAQRVAIFAEFAARTPVGRVGRAEEVADAIAFLIGNGFVDGHVLVCDGGIRLGR